MLGSIDSSPGPAPMSGAISSPTFTGISHHPRAHARTPHSPHDSAYSASRSGTVRGMAPSEFDTRYVVRSRIGNSSRNSSRVSIAPSTRSEFVRRDSLADFYHRGTENTENLHTGEGSPCRDEM